LAEQDFKDLVATDDFDAEGTEVLEDDEVDDSLERQAVRGKSDICSSASI
jgi:hypothetical protein